jgi:hypothetical protein
MATRCSAREAKPNQPSANHERSRGGGVTKVTLEFLEFGLQFDGDVDVENCVWGRSRLSSSLRGSTNTMGVD